MASIAQHTKDRDIIVTWKNENGDVIPLTGATSIKGVLRLGREPDNTDVTITGTLSVYDAANGQHKWTISALDSSVSGHFTLYFYVTFSDGSIMPSMGAELDIIPTAAVPV